MTNVTDPTAAPAKTPTTKRTQKTRVRRKARRRDGADSEEEGGSASDASDASDSKATPATAAKPKLTPLFPDENSTTPAAWADMTDKGEEITFDDFNRGDPARRGIAVRGRGRGGKVAREPREMTEEQKKREEETAAARREKLKAKRKAKKEAERASKSAAKADPGAATTAVPAAAPATVNAESSLAASTSALKLDDPPAESTAPAASAPSVSPADGTPRPGIPPRTNRNAYTQRVAEDPKFTPRVGNFWMHDQRHYEAGSVGEGSFAGLRGMSDFWRGRGGMRGMPRGGFRGVPPPRGRGRGRGFAFVPPVRQMSPAPSPSSASTSASGPGPAPYRGKAVPPATASSSGHRMAEMDKLEMELQNKARHNRAGANEGKWGHEGFEEIAAHEDPMRHNHMIRGRGRGRGRGGFMRGGPPLRPMPPGVAHLPTPEASPDRSASKTEPRTEAPTTTGPSSETLLEDSGAVTVKLPGGAKSVDVDRPPSQPTEAPEQPKSPFPPAFTPSNPSPVPYVASDSGSISSGYVPTGPMMPMHTGEYYNHAPPFRAPGPGFYPPYRPQSFTPEPHFVPGQQPRGSFSGPAPFYPGAPAHARPGSPLNPYQAPYGQAAYFVPARPTQKVSIRSPRGSTDEIKSPATEPEAVGTPEFVHAQPFYQQQGYNPYANGEVYYQGYWPGYEGGSEYGYAEQYHGHPY
ncbi:hypothetical protein CC85DRAFT_286234 [Cutaneotrichosporon oleaginosum]|uniref:Btz domain-containing protein n=1 Tax=Cutaneotrichosporon oleaginosum TaxID=879819 RepID=A0A0J1B258_9TREE|nr:uncharacterized protein CC85DRAFT_286234 [Cutaneotrichosporon oleaginosum]KLT41699.1 hypothetical protein CC85DRAFT_286234 [Cutaneotrichosporon oleaginosum]TXT08071.1 hypothetical protein COLE_04995 [Cutaneotrichosporon oleaginosum]